MKKLRKITNILIMAMAIAAVFTSCKKTLPSAGFTYAPETVVQYDVVEFTNVSTDATSYLWDFGNGAFTSTEANPNIQFLTAGEVVVKLTATNEDGDQTTEQTITVAAFDKYWMLDDKKIAITTDFAWATGHGGNYLKLSSTVNGQDNPDELRLTPVQDLEGLPGTYTWDGDSAPSPVGTYDFTYFADFSGGFGGWAWYGVGKSGSGDILIEEVDTDIYKITGKMIITVGTWDYSVDPPVYTETTTHKLTLNYVGPITPLAK